MPGFTAYMDTPVIPTMAFADGYNLPDTEYPNNTPAIKSVVGNSGVAGPWVNAGGTLTITAMGDKVVQNPNFSGPNSTLSPYNQKTITRHYGFGSTAGTVALVDAAGVSHPLVGTVTWSDSTITGTVPADLPNCSASNASYKGANATAKCGQLVITAADGKRSIDAITVTIGGTAPWIVAPTGVTAPAGKTVHDYGENFGRMGPSPIQTAIDSASPGDLIIVTPGTYRENLIMWQPVRLQGVGAGSVTINADAHPAGKMDQWRRQVDCVFGLDLDGIPNMNNASFDKSGAYTCPAVMHQRVDRIQFEAITGWDASGNGNLAQVLQEPTLMGAYEGAGITVLGRGIKIPANSNDFWGNDPAAAGAFPVGSVYLAGTSDCSTASTTRVDGRDYGSANFYCNPSRIDGVSIINSSQGGGGLFIHGWAQNLEVANNRISGNHGTLAGGINLGNGETPAVYLNDGTICGAGVATADTCPPIPNGTLPNAAIPFAWNTNVRIHHNMIYNNASIGDALFTGTPAGAGAITVSAGADRYSIDHNWIAGNLSTGDGGGMQQLGVSFNARIASNYILFNQTSNPTLPTSGGGIVIQAANEPRMLNGTECGAATDYDCPPGLGEGTGPGLVIDANLILGNSAESGSGGGMRLQQINGTEMVNFPLLNSQWYGVSVTNNIIANNVAGYDGGGVSLQDALKVSFINNTVTSNDTTASAGSLFKTLGAINASSPPPGCSPVTDPSLPQDPGCLGQNAPHGPQPAGLVTMRHTSNLIDALAGVTPILGVKLACPLLGYGYTGTLGANGDCQVVSKPGMVNNVFWHNRSFSVDIISLGSGNQSQQNLIALTPALNQTSTGDCSTGTVSLPGSFYYDIGLRTDDVTSGVLTTTGNKLSLLNSILTQDYQGVITASASNKVASGSHVRGTVLQRRTHPAGELRRAGQPDHHRELQGLQHAGRRVGDDEHVTAVRVQRHPAHGDGRRRPQLAQPELRPADAEPADGRRGDAGREAGRQRERRPGRRRVLDTRYLAGGRWRPGDGAVDRARRTGPRLLRLGARRIGRHRCGAVRLGSDAAATAAGDSGTDAGIGQLQSRQRQHARRQLEPTHASRVRRDPPQHQPGERQPGWCRLLERPDGRIRRQAGRGVHDQQRHLHWRCAGVEGHRWYGHDPRHLHPCQDRGGLGHRRNDDEQRPQLHDARHSCRDLRQRRHADGTGRRHRSGVRVEDDRRDDDLSGQRGDDVHRRRPHRDATADRRAGRQLRRWHRALSRRQRHAGAGASRRPCMSSQRQRTAT